MLATGCALGGDTLNIRVFSIGQADSILLSDGRTHVLIDTGESDDGEQIAEALLRFGIRKLDCLILTHFDKDHIGGTPDLLKQIAVDRIIMPTYTADSKRYTKLIEALDKHGLQAERLAVDTSVCVGNISMDIWTPKAAYTDSDNEQSLVVRVTYGQTSILVAGDAEDIRTTELLEGNYPLDCDILKVPHHGRWHETSAALLDAATPSYALITDSAKNPAEKELVAFLDARGIQTMRTVDGDLVLSITGERIDTRIDPS